MIIDESQQIDNAQQQNKNHSQDSEVVLSVRGVSKKFCRDLKKSLFYGVQDIAGDLTGLRTKSDRLREKEFWALNNVSLELRKGEALGLVGKNGSGKSTLLRIIAGLVKPDLGTIEITGRVAPLIALGAGFNPILTGRENIYANMAILGLSKKEIDERFCDVVEFAEVGDAIDSPVQTYSSGMAARLGFASAIHTEPDILLIDEVLAVGDIRFRAKCHRRLHELRQKGKSFVLVSHNAPAILNVCNSAIYLSKGELIAAGDTASIMHKYEENLFFNRAENPLGRLHLPEKSDNQSLGLDIKSIFFRDENENIIDSPVTGELTYLCVECKARKEINNASLFLGIREVAGEGDFILHLSSFYDNEVFDILPGEHEIRLKMPHMGLKPNLYTIKAFLKKDSLYTLDSVESFIFAVDGQEKKNRGLFYQPRKWEIVKK